jgi:hypothetical protein
VTIAHGSWPLLQAVARDPELSAIYHAAIIETAAELDGPLDARIDELIVRIEGAITREDEVHRGTTRAFVDAVESLRAHNAAQAEHIDAHLRALGLR